MWECKKCHERHEDSFGICWKCGTSKAGVADPTFARVVQDESVLAPDDRITTSQRRQRTTPSASDPRIEKLVFVGLNGYALALDRDTGEIVWSNNQMKSGYVTLLLDGDRLIVSTNGYIFCLDPLTGQILWNNPLKGYGMGAPTSLISVRGQSSTSVIQQAGHQVAQAAADSTTHTG